MALLSILILISALTVTGLAADFPEATLRFANYYGDHMVLQRAPHSANVWGFMPACDDKVEVTFGEKMYDAMLSQGELVCILSYYCPKTQI